MTPLCISVPEAAKALGISKTHAYELAHAGELPTLQLGARRIVVPVAALEQLVEQAIARSPLAKAHQPGPVGGERGTTELESTASRPRRGASPSHAHPDESALPAGRADLEQVVPPL